MLHTPSAAMLHNCHRRQSCTTRAWPSYTLRTRLFGADHLLSVQPVRHCVQLLGRHSCTAPEIAFAHLPTEMPVGHPIRAPALPPLFPHRHEAHNIPHLSVKQRIGKPRGRLCRQPRKPGRTVELHPPVRQRTIVDPLFTDSGWFCAHRAAPRSPKCYPTSGSLGGLLARAARKLRPVMTTLSA